MKIQDFDARANRTNGRANASGRLWRETKGQELLEMAFAISMLLALVVGIFWAGRAYNIYTTVNRAAREGARIAVAPSCATCGNAFPSTTTVQAAVDGVLAASSLQTPSTANTANCPPPLGTVTSVTVHLSAPVARVGPLQLLSYVDGGWSELPVSVLHPVRSS